MNFRTYVFLSEDLGRLLDTFCKRPIWTCEKKENINRPEWKFCSKTLFCCNIFWLFKDIFLDWELFASNFLLKRQLYVNECCHGYTSCSVQRLAFKWFIESDVEENALPIQRLGSRSGIPPADI